MLIKEMVCNIETKLCIGNEERWVNGRMWNSQEKEAGGERVY